ncbi:MAG: FAD-binding protein [Patescibacteria group bacterium]
MKDPEFLTRYGVRVNEPIAGKTKIETGGNADFYAEVDDARTLRSILAAAADNALPVTVIGCGSRVVCGDHGYRGLLVRYRARRYELADGDVVVDAGLPVHELIGRLTEEERGGLEAFAGYAGSVGGAIAEGATRGTLRFADRIKEVSLCSGGRAVDVTPADLKYGEHGSARLGEGKEWVLAARLSTVRRDPAESTRLIAEAIQERLRGEPAGKPFVFVFRDPARKRARDLLAEAGMGGAREGGALVSEKNANAIINDAGATARDVYNLAQRMKARAKMQLGAKLTESAVWLGER